MSERGGGHQLNETHEFIAILGNPKICSAMALAMSIYRTLCVLVFFKLDLNPRDLSIFLLQQVCTGVKLVDEPRLRCWGVNGMRDDRVKLQS